MRTKLFAVSYLLPGKFLITSNGHDEASVLALASKVLAAAGQFNVVEQAGPQSAIFDMPEGVYHMMMGTPEGGAGWRHERNAPD
jgi:hypothetical protein